ncbi:MAG: cyclase [Candidatus Bipolaricaulia bacterium]
MPYVLVRHKVEDYAKWKPVFDEHGATRKTYGSKGGYVFRNVDDPNEVVILIEGDDLEKIRQFAQSEDLRQTMQRAGVADQPDVYFLEETDRPSV